MRGVRADTQVTVEQFAGLFLRGNPFLAITSLVGYHLAKDERDVIQITERLGGTKSPLTVEELLEVLEDPRFNVRFEAIISIARMRPDPRLTEAVIQTLNGTELALSTVSAWALGRIGDERAAQALRQGLSSPYNSIQAHCARALGALGDREITPALRERLQQERDKGLQMAYASALGNLRAKESDKLLLDLLYTFENEGARMELALSLARLAGDEGHFIQLLRQARQDTGTATAQALTTIKRKISKERAGNELLNTLDGCIDALARNDLEQGATLLSRLICLLPPENFEACAATILQACAERLGETEATRLEYLLLALHALEVGWQM
ncbi:HEAT repeat domain-containing protein [Reichenbachiella sp.]|uniref:HEAT repeat domain-containing protein n=1 Tax=Reichenbachiella sp. TaxID=2184521 RepID=UPI003B59A0CD